MAPSGEDTFWTDMQIIINAKHFYISQQPNIYVQDKGYIGVDIWIEIMCLQFISSNYNCFSSGEDILDGQIGSGKVSWKFIHYGLWHPSCLVDGFEYEHFNQKKSSDRVIASIFHFRTIWLEYFDRMRKPIVQKMTHFSPFEDE